MEEIEVCFEQDEKLDHVQVVIRAAEKNDNVKSLMKLVSGYSEDKLTAQARPKQRDSIL